MSHSAPASTYAAQPTRHEVGATDDHVVAHAEPLGLGRGGVVVVTQHHQPAPRHRERRARRGRRRLVACSRKRSTPAAPPVPAVGVGRRHLAHRRDRCRRPTPGNRGRACASTASRSAVDALGHGAEVEPEALVLLLALAVAGADRRRAVARDRGCAPTCRSRWPAPRWSQRRACARASPPRCASSPPRPRPSTRTSRSRVGARPAALRRNRWSYANTRVEPARLRRVRDRERGRDVVRNDGSVIPTFTGHVSARASTAAPTTPA